MEWLTTTVTAALSLIVGIVGAVMFMWQKFATMRAELAHKELELTSRRHDFELKAEKEEFELEKVRKAETYRDLVEANKRQATEIEDLAERLTAQEARISLLTAESLECHKKNAAQELELFRQSKLAEVQAGVIQVLEVRVKTLEAYHLPAVATQGAALASAVKAVANEAIEESKTTP